MIYDSGKMFNSVAAEESSNLRLYLTVLFLLCTSCYLPYYLPIYCNP